MTRVCLALLAALLVSACTTTSAAISDPVRLDAGLVSGAQGSAPGVYAFKGIPFAAPPVGELRWQAPQPVAKWDGVRQADEFGAVCVQPPGTGRLNVAVLPTGPPVSEDCLYLNVWTAAASASERRPVMVWIYGGAFTEGGGAVDLYNGQALAGKGAVVVTLNYRLGPFGFFAHPELSKESGRNASGNYGIMDALAALRWVQTNIAAFGGDPGNVTVFGQSAGAMMIGSLVASPESRDLFHRAIGQSGSWMGLGMGTMRTLESAEAAGLKAAASIGATTVAELRAKSADEVQKALRGAGMIVDGWIIPEDASATYAEGRQNQVDVLVGANEDEGSFAGGNTTVEQWTRQVQQRWGDMADEYLTLYPAGSDAEAAASSAKAFADQAFWHMRLMADRQVERGRRAYLYWFTFDPPTAPEERDLGATHAAEIPFVFNNLSAPRLYPDGSSAELSAASPAARTLADTMSSYWVNFARTGDPNGPGLTEWPAYRDKSSGPVIILGERVEVQAPDSARLDMYDRLYARMRAN